jgi:hypothetical protein
MLPRKTFEKEVGPEVGPGLWSVAVAVGCAAVPACPPVPVCASTFLPFCETQAVKAKSVNSVAAINLIGFSPAHVFGRRSKC